LFLNKFWKPKPWVAVLVGVLLQPMTFLYVQKVKLFWLYFLLTSFIAIIDWYCQVYFTALFSLVCPVHAYVVAKRIEPTDSRKWYSLWWGIPLIYALIITSTFMIRSFFYEPFSIPASSMSPYLNVGDHVIVKKYGFGTYGTYGISIINGTVADDVQLVRGRVYVFYPPHKDGIPFVKRLIGLPGDRVSIGGRSISINDEILPSVLVSVDGGVSIFEESNNGVTYQIQRSKLTQRPFNIMVPDNQYFFLGDNRDNSSDSRRWGGVQKNRFLGEVVYVLNK